MSTSLRLLFGAACGAAVVLLVVSLSTRARPAAPPAIPDPYPQVGSPAQFVARNAPPPDRFVAALITRVTIRSPYSLTVDLRTFPPDNQPSAVWAGLPLCGGGVWPCALVLSR